jgi:hypothetical protein
MKLSGVGNMHSYVGCTRDQHVGVRSREESLVTITATLRSPSERRIFIMNYRLIGAAALSVMLATPAMAMQHRHHHHYGYIHKGSPEFGYGSTYGAYAFYPRDDFAAGNHSLDFDRRNTFN